MVTTGLPVENRNVLCFPNLRKDILLAGWTLARGVFV